MRIVRFKTPSGRVQHGILRGDQIRPLEGNILGRHREKKNSVPMEGAALLAPIVPVNMLCLGRNYKAHAEEGGAAAPTAPALFIKATSCLQDPGGPIELPKVAPGQVDYEAELAIVIGKKARHVSEAEALDCVLGYTCANDVSARDCQAGDLQWARAKSFDTFGPLGPWIETELDPSDLQICLRLNSRILQNSSTRHMIFPVPVLISYLSRCMTLLPGTVILTGTPDGCGFARKPPIWLKPGDTVEVDIEGIGTLTNPVVNEP